jgi:hypothetical protein
VLDNTFLAKRHASRCSAGVAALTDAQQKRRVRFFMASIRSRTALGRRNQNAPSFWVCTVA